MATLYGTSGNDTLIGGADNDTLYGDTGNDFLDGGFGNDSLDGGFGNDTLNGGAGNDTLNGVVGNDSLDGGAGNDSFTVNAGGDNTIIGGTGVDTLSVTSGSSIVIVLSYDSVTGNGTITGNGKSTTFSGIEGFEILGSSSVIGGQGNDSLYGTSDNDSLIGGAGNDLLSGGDIFFSPTRPGESGTEYGSDSLDGGAGNDTLLGDAGSDLLNGGSGNDFLGVAGDRHDTINGGTGIDTLSVGYTYYVCDSFFCEELNYATSGLVMTYNPVTGDGTITGGTVSATFSGIEAFRTNGTYYDDSLIGGIGNDALNGSFGDDSLSGGFGNDSLNGGAGNDSLSINGRGRDTIDGGAGNDTLRSDYGASSTGISMTYNAATGSGTIIGSGASTTFRGIETFNISGSLYGDTMLGGIGNDTLDGYARNDSLNGGAGNDYLLGARAAAFGVGEIDTLTGGTGADIFVLANTSGAFYNDGNNTTAGLSDYALITDFSASVDKIQLKSGLSYVLGAVPGAVGLSGTGIFIDNDGIAGLSAKDELVGVIKNVNLTPGAITNGTAGFKFV